MAVRNVLEPLLVLEAQLPGCDLGLAVELGSERDRIEEEREGFHPPLLALKVKDRGHRPTNVETSSSWAWFFLGGKQGNGVSVLQPQGIEFRQQPNEQETDSCLKLPGRHAACQHCD